MNAQRHLFKPPIADGNLSSKQLTVLEYLQANTNGMRAIDIGRHLHREQPNPCLYCSDDRTCQYAMRDIGPVLDSLGTSGRQLVIRRHTGLWELTAAARPHDTGTFPTDY